MAVSLGYKNVYRYPKGYPEWHDRGLPVSTIDFPHVSLDDRLARSTAVPVPTGFHFILVLAAVFLGGVALNLTPCIYPLIPITVSYFGGRSEATQGSKMLHGISYILGLALTNSTLGVTAAMTGGLLGSLLQNSMVLIGIATILLLFAFSLFGAWEIRLPSRLNVFATRTYKGYGGTLFMGLTLGIIAAPCIGPFVIGLLSWVAAIGKNWFGFVVFFTLSIGMGVPLFILALFSSNINRLPRSGEWMIWVKKVMGWILVGMAAYFIRPLVTEFQSVILYSAIALSAGIHLCWLDKSTTQSRGFRWLRNGIGIICLGIAILIAGQHILRGPGVNWTQYTPNILEQAKAKQKPVIIDFYASWCTPCRELDDTTFHHPEIVNLSAQVVMIKVDLTTGANDDYQELIDRYQIKGVPTILFIDSEGKERRDLRLVDYLPPDTFIERMNGLL